MKRVVVLGSTGSVGTQTLDVLARVGDRFSVVGLAAGHWSEAFAAQIAQWEPGYAAVDTDGATAGAGSEVALFTGPGSLERLVEATGPDIVVLATPGLVGLSACLTALRAGGIVALANKEPMVAAGQLVKATAREYDGAIVPVDSEHNGVWQCLRGEERESIAQIILTSSGGSFRDTPLDQLPEATVEDALKHPTWSMGPKITVDSATLMNKGLEIIEASWLFDMPPSAISIALHRQSIVHALVEFVDGSIKAQLAVPDMRLPILNALMYPERVGADLPKLDVRNLGSLTFEPVDDNRYPSIPLARSAAEAGGTCPTVLNAANEVAVDRFLAGEIRFTDIVPLVQRTLDRHNHKTAAGTLEEIEAADAWARRACRTLNVKR